MISVCTQLDIDHPNYDRTNRVLACINLTKAVLHHDKDHLAEIVKDIEASDKKDLANKFLVKSLLNCYNTLSMIKVADLLGKKKFQDINPFKKDNKEILDMSKYDERYGDNKEKLEKETEKLEELMKGTTTEVCLFYQNVVSFFKRYD